MCLKSQNTINLVFTELWEMQCLSAPFKLHQKKKGNNSAIQAKQLQHIILSLIAQTAGKKRCTSAVH